MTGSVLQPDLPLAADDGALMRVLRQAGLGRDCVIRVTGPAGLTAVLCLYRRGYERAAYVHPNWVTVRGAADALLIPHACGMQELAGLLERGDGLREGGILIVQTCASRSSQPADGLPAILEPRGYEIEQHVSDRGRAM